MKPRYDDLIKDLQRWDRPLHQDEAELRSRVVAALTVLIKENQELQQKQRREDQAIDSYRRAFSHQARKLERLKILVGKIYALL